MNNLPFANLIPPSILTEEQNTQIVLITFCICYNILGNDILVYVISKRKSLHRGIHEAFMFIDADSIYNSTNLIIFLILQKHILSFPLWQQLDYLCV